ncbi:MAG: hypothetical protein ACQJCO_03515 [cyanobacterium endosymbiont of Rhopalodia sterrenbergii]
MLKIYIWFGIITAFSLLLSVLSLFNTPYKIQAVREGKLSMIASSTNGELSQIALNTLIKGINKMELENTIETDSGLQYVKIKEGIKDFLSKSQTVTAHHMETLKNEKIG